MLARWARAVATSLPRINGTALLASALSAVAALGDAKPAALCLAVLAKQAQSRSALHPVNPLEAEHAPAVVELCRVYKWAPQCGAALSAVVGRLCAGTPPDLAVAAALLKGLRAASVGATAAQPTERSSGGGGGAGHPAAAVFAAALAGATTALAGAARQDGPGQGAERRREQQEVAAGLLQVLALVEERGDAEALHAFFTTAFARHFITAAAGAGGAPGAAA